MYSVLLVDDEKIIREGVFELLSMADLDLDLVMAGSAVEAVGILEERKIDIVVADICMPQMSGLELFDVIRDRWPHCKVIFLTGHLEFDYVYKVHKYARYVLKAEEDSKIVDAVKESIVDLENDFLLEHIIEEKSEHQRYSQYYERMLLQRELVDGHASFSNVTEEAWKSLDIHIDRNKEVYCVMLRRDDMARDFNYSKAAQASRNIGTLIDKYYLDGCLGTYFEYNRMITYILLQPKKLVTQERCIKLLAGISELFQKAVQKNLDEAISIYICNTPVSFKHAFMKFTRIKDKMVPMAVNEIKIDDINEETDIAETLTEQKKQRMIQLIQRLDDGFWRFDYEEIKHALQGLGKLVQGVKSMHDLFVIESYCSISTRLLGYIKKLNLSDKIAFKISIMNLYNVSFHASWGDAFAYLIRIVDNIFDLRELSIESKNQDVVNKVKGYILSHLEGDTSLYVLAEYVHLSQEYLLRVFKSTEGVTILQYINDLKFEKAKALLGETDDPMKEIASQLGFTSTGYFGRFFKSRLGITPHAYREGQRVS